MANDLYSAVPEAAAEFVLRFRPRFSAYGQAAACAVLAGLGRMKFSGRCEYYAWEGGAEGVYLVGVTLGAFPDEAAPTELWWQGFVTAVGEACDQGLEVTLEGAAGRAEADAFRAGARARGAAGFTDGLPTAVLCDCRSWFVGECRGVMRERARDTSRSGAAGAASFISRTGRLFSPGMADIPVDKGKQTPTSV
jgi:hypothetical protein